MMNLEQALREEMKNSLPGRLFHDKMLPLRSPVNIPIDLKGIQAAVALIILHQKQPEIILIKRSEYQGYHSGQVSFPGGKTDPRDKDPIETSIRETYEEIGIVLQRAECVGELTSLYIQVSGFHVKPYVFCIDREINLKIDKEEVNYIIQAPVSRLLDDDLIRSKTFKSFNVKFQAPYMDIKGEIVWGATSMILSEFTEILKRIKKKYTDLL